MDTLKNNVLLNLSNSTFVKMPAPLNISLWWNYGSLLGLCLMSQVITGLFMAMFYSNHMNYAFLSVVHITQDIESGWVLRNLHAAGASFFFLCMYTHMGRGLYYGSYHMINTWMVGVTLLLLTMATAFLGYVLPWGQMSLWGATVITNLLSSFPFIGQMLVQWLWGGSSVENPTLMRFFTFHFLCPFIIMAFVVIHISFLHQTGSNNPLGISSKTSKIFFHPYFVVKDLVSFLILLLLMMIASLGYPYLLMDPENFNQANPINSPIHIKPEWYYLFAYAILRSIPSKLGGVMALITAVLIFYTLPLTMKEVYLNMNKIFKKKMIWIFLSTILLLTWIGAKEVEAPYIFTSQMLSMLYFLCFLCFPLTKQMTPKSY